MSYKEYTVDDLAVDEWLSWGGITRPAILEQKDHSLFSVLTYLPWKKDFLTKEVEFPEFRRGWGFWSERQHTPTEEKNYLALFWNPFIIKNKSYIANTLNDEKVARENYRAYFEYEMGDFTNKIQQITTAKQIEYQELINFLTFSLSVGDCYFEMPETPLALDVYLSQDITFKFAANDIFINDKRVLILTLPSLPNPEKLFELFADKPYRYVRRLLTFDSEETEAEMDKYLGSWCPGRKTTLKEIQKGIVDKLNGYYHNGFIFHLPQNEYDDFRKYITDILTDMELPFIIEKYNLKDIWWGSLPGMYLSNITPPLLGFSSVTDLLIKKPLPKQDARNQFQEIIDNVSGGEGIEDVPQGQI